MKKIIVLVISFLIFPLLSLAANYKIEHFYVDATLEKNGDMSVQELIVLKGSFNGYERDILHTSSYGNYSASQIENLEISGKYVDNVSLDTFDESFETFNQVDYALNGDKNKYILSDITNGLRMRMYYKTENSTTGFLIKYTLKDVGISHADMIEYYWNFFGTDFEDDIKDIKIRVNYPGLLNEEDFNWWFHGSLAGNSSIIKRSDNYTSVLATLDKLEKYNPVDFRTLAPKNIFSSEEFKKQDSENVREEIIKTEDEIVANDLKTIKKVKIIYYTFVTLGIGFYIYLILIWIYVYKKFDKERIPKFQNKYNREFIDDYNVEVIDYLMNNSITPNAMSASIMNMIYKKNISAEKLPEGKNEYKFKLLTTDKLNETEVKLVDFLFKTVGKEDEFTTKELKRYASSTKTCDKFMASYTAWQNKVIEDGKKEEFFDKIEGRFKFGALTLILAFLIYFVGVQVFHIEFFLLHTVIFAAIIFIVYLGTIQRKSEKGIEHYAMWKGFKNFLNDFGAFDTKELPEIILWERYLVYATIFGLADKVSKTMNVKIKEMDISALNNTDTYIFINNFGMPNIINGAISSAYHGAQTAINRENANASGGSFGGHGGGFSSGGGFGGGGGGGRGF